MNSRLGPIRLGFRELSVILLPLGLWAMIWLSLSAGNPSQIINPSSPVNFIHGLRAIFPLLSGYLALAFIAVKLFRGQPHGFNFTGPLLFTVIYGLAGVASSILSPNWLVSLQWVGAYLAVPVVLWVIVWGTDTLERLRQVINMTSLVIVLGVAALFAVAVVALGLGDIITDPITFLDCRHVDWYDLTSGKLRETGVGRYAAIAVIVGISGLWQQRWRMMWIVVMMAAGMMLLTSGARGSFMGLAAGATVTALLYDAKKVVIVGLVGFAVLVPLFWSTGHLPTFLDKCIFRGSISALKSQPKPPSELDNALTIQAPSPSNTPAAANESPQGKSLQPSSETSGSSTQIPAQDQQEQQRRPEDGSGGTLGASVVEQPVSEIPIPPGTVDDGSGPEGKSAEEKEPVKPEPPTQQPPLSRQAKEFLQFTGRTAVWAEALRMLKRSPLLGYGFHADRLLLGTHMHNAVMHAAFQTGILGTVPFLIAILYGWFLLVKGLRRISRLPTAHKHLFIQSAGLLVFFSLRAIPESTGAFFGVDWLIIAPILFYLQVLSRTHFDEGGKVQQA